MQTTQETMSWRKNWKKGGYDDDLTQKNSDKSECFLGVWEHGIGGRQSIQFDGHRLQSVFPRYKEQRWRKKYITCGQ